MSKIAASCEGRGWFHDGSEVEEAIFLGRPARKCPNCGQRAS